MYDLLKRAVEKFFFLTLLLSTTASTQSFAQVTFQVNGTADNRDGYYAFTNATIFTDYQTKIEKATLIIKNGKIEAVGAGLAVPKGATEITLQGRFIYPSFIDLYSNYGLPAVTSSGNGGNQPENKNPTAVNWNQAVKPETSAQDKFIVSGVEAEKLRSLGFGVVLSHLQDGIFRGTGSLIALGEGKSNELIMNGKASQHYSFNKGTSTQNYPSSLMGSIALIRQTYLDADWYKKTTDKKEFNLSLEAYNQISTLPAIFESTDVLSSLRADKIGDEFGIQYIIKGAGDEYQRLQLIKNTNAKLIIPLNFPEAYDIQNPLDEKNIALREMKHWELAPANAAMLSKEGITFSFTRAGLKNPDDFLKNIAKAIENGLDEKEALKAITLTPAEMMKVSDKIGSLASGKMANFIITSNTIFNKDNTILQNWVMGKAYLVKGVQAMDLRGNYQLNADGQNYKLIIGGSIDNPSFKVEKDGTALTTKGSYENQQVALNFSSDAVPAIRLNGWFDNKNMKGNGTLNDGKIIQWIANFESPFQEEVKTENQNKKELALGKVIYPFVSFGNEELPKQEAFLIKNTTVWTNEKEGILKETDVLIKDGKIVQVGKGINGENAKVIDGTGKHLTNGIIDEHSHIAMSRGINEGAHSSTAEVRVGDIVNSEDINIYRQLAGGVCASQILHGSANAIGGQSALIKLKWGYAPEEMKIPNADGFIKFALGENVKQANWGDDYTTRFPQTRMGVEQVYVDAFTRAREYDALSKTKGANFRRNLNLEAVAEILNKKRFITCHSYVQSEINMLIKVAEQFDFKVNTFTHILEGYKVADKMAAHGSGGSSFADWWAYKMEVKDAIPYNAALMNNVGVVTAINSDDAEMARRLNQEAAKAVKYGNISEEDAWKMVTLNPAKLLHLDNRMGSIKAGKDADLVVWSDNPLSIYAVVEKNIIDGILFFDLEKEAEKQSALQKERARLVQKMTEAKNGGSPTQKAVDKKDRIWHCEDFIDVFKEENEKK